MACAAGAWILFDVGLIGAILAHLAVSFSAALAILLAGFLKHVACRGTHAGGTAGTDPPLTVTGNCGETGGP